MKEQTGVFSFKNIPWNGIGHFDPSIFRIHMKAQWLIENKEAALCIIGIFVHCFFTPKTVLFYRKLHEK